MHRVPAEADVQNDAEAPRALARKRIEWTANQIPGDGRLLPVRWPDGRLCPWGCSLPQPPVILPNRPTQLALRRLLSHSTCPAAAGQVTRRTGAGRLRLREQGVSNDS